MTNQSWPLGLLKPRVRSWRLRVAIDARFCTQLPGLFACVREPRLRRAAVHGKTTTGCELQVIHYIPQTTVESSARCLSFPDRPAANDICPGQCTQPMIRLLIVGICCAAVSSRGTVLLLASGGHTSLSHRRERSGYMPYLQGLDSHTEPITTRVVLQRYLPASALNLSGQSLLGPDHDGELSK